MAIEKYVVVSGVSGVHKLVTARSNGVIILDSVQGKTRFVPAKTSDVTPLGMISVFTDTEDGAIALKDVFQRMTEQITDHPVPSADAQSQILRDYFIAIIPEHDEVRVRITDIKKIVKWYNYMVTQNMLEEVMKDDEVAAAAETETKTEE
jgi:hypothetical protein